MRGEFQQQRSSVMGDLSALEPARLLRRHEWPVALISMPFASASMPSLALGLLKPIAASHGFPVETFHLNLDFAAEIGWPLYERLPMHADLAVGDWLFSIAAFGDGAPDPTDAFLHRFSLDLARLLDVVNVDAERLSEIRREIVPRYLESLLSRVAWERFRVVAFTSTFQQNGASIALAAALKRYLPDVVTIFGGANFEGEMGAELVRAVECIDYAVSGEADVAFAELLVALAEGSDPAQVAGAVCSGRAPTPARLPFDQLDELPVPDYDEFFTRAEALGVLGVSARRVVPIPFESARGCWWGAKRHCTFCGLNGASMAFRTKTPERVEAELAELAKRCRSFHFLAADNILEPSYLETLLPHLATSGTTYRIRYDVKADLTRGQIELLRDAGVWVIQPGIESLSSHVLRLMRKGTRAWQNVNVMRWSAYHGLFVVWNLIWGFPGETEADYQVQAALLPSLVHLQPPSGRSRIRMDRFSPIFADRASFPASYAAPASSYAYVYPQDIDMVRAGYYYDSVLDGALPDSAFEEIGALVLKWKHAWEREPRPSLRYWSAPGFLQIDDHRDPARPGTYTFDEPLASLYLAASDRAVTAVEASETLKLRETSSDIEEAMAEFCVRGLMMRDGNLFLSLAIPATGGWPGEPLVDASALVAI
jgi:ribosomal peptide maturation radical SAM protein 1